MQIDVFTLMPHAFSWLTEQRPLAAVLGSELELKLLNYRDFTPLSGGQVDDEPYGGGAGMVLRVDVVYAALEAVYGAERDRRVIAFSPQGRQLDQGLVDELAGEEALTLLSARFEGFDERILEHVATDVVSIGPYVLSGGELPAMVVLDAVARRLPGAIREESAAVESFSDALEGGLEFPHYTRPAEFRGWRVPDVLLSGNHALIERWRRSGAGAVGFVRGPLDRITGSLPAPWDTVVDWVLTITIAVAAVLAIKAWVVNPYRIPSSSMEPTLHCAAPEIGCQAGASDRVLANRFIYRFRDPERGDIVVFDVPSARSSSVGHRHLREAARGPSGRHDRPAGWRAAGERGGRPGALSERRPEGRQLRAAASRRRRILHDGRQPRPVMRQPRWGPVSRDDLIGPVFAVYWPLTRLGLR